MVDRTTRASGTAGRRITRRSSQSVRRFSCRIRLAITLGLSLWVVGAASAAENQTGAVGNSAGEAETSAAAANRRSVQASSTNIFVAPLTFITAEEFELIENGQLKTELHESTEPIAGGPVREGHTQVFWVPDPEAAAYRLSDQAGHVVYTGRFTKAFVSGLPSGRHEFSVVALDDQQNVIRRGSGSTVVDVMHWSPAVTWSLFALGAVVFIALITLLTIGHRRTSMNGGEAGSGQTAEDAGAVSEKTETTGTA